ncbi:MAG: hypothetical protein RMY34_28375 [Aulosira sp. DedQUE10]|nr:hypothetical protein [Aulosira sp. DedQUE10]
MERIIRLNAVETSTQRSSYRMKLDYLHPYYDPSPEKISIHCSAVTIARATVPETSTNDRHIKRKEWSEWSQVSGFSLQKWQKLLRTFGISACTD